MSSVDAVIKFLKKNKSFLISSHKDPEGDSIGSQLAMASLLRRMKKSFVILNEDLVPQAYRFLPQARSLIRPCLRTRRNFDAAIILDCPCLERAGSVFKYLKVGCPILNIDHHPSNQRFGHINWVDQYASSTGEMIYRLFSGLSLDIGKREALFLYVAILTDTGSFKFSNTGARTHRIVAELIKAGNIRPHQIYRNIYGSFSFRNLKSLGKTLESLHRSRDGKVAWIVLDKDMQDRLNGPEGLTDVLMNMVRLIEGVEVAILFRQAREKGKIKISLRSSPRVNVDKIARTFGGGGHKTASGCIVSGGIDRVENLVLREVNRHLSGLV
jgi:phosphoesterase RecJ-like protein